MKNIFFTFLMCTIVSASHMIADYERCKFVDDCSNPLSVCEFGTKLGEMGWMLCAPMDTKIVPSGKYAGYTLTYYDYKYLPNTLASIGAIKVAVSSALMFVSVLSN